LPKVRAGPEVICDRLDHPVADLFFAPDDPWVDADGDVNLVAADAEPVDAAPEPEQVDGQPAADSNVRHAVYSDLLRQLELSTEHFEDLRRRGLTAKEINRRGYRTADAGKFFKTIDGLLAKHGREKVLTVPGFSEKNDRVVFTAGKGIIIPVRDVAGNMVALKVRHDNAYNGPKYTWVSTQDVSCGNLVHVPLGTPVPAETVRLTEGELKADVATCLSKVPTVSAPGVGNWSLAVPLLQAMGAKNVLLAMDQDGKPGTLATIEKAMYGLTRDGFEVTLEWWDSQVAKGIDDLLAAGKQPDVGTGLAAAVRVRDLLAGPETEGPGDEEPEPPPFPADVFPPQLATFCREVAEATSSPPDFAGVTMVVIAGAAIGNSRALALKHNTWLEAPRFFAAVVADPGGGKTPAQDAVVKPYHALQLRLLAQYAQQKAAYETAKADYEHTLKENRALPEDERKPLPLVPDEPREPERFVVMDATVESLAPLLAQNPRGLLMPQDEGVGWVRGMGQYKQGRGNDRQFWLSTWSGKSHLVDRKSQGLVPVSIPRPFVNVMCGIQPEMLGELADHKGRNDGFLHRVLFTFPRARAGGDWTEVTVSTESQEAWEDTLAKLRKLTMTELNDGGLGYKAVQFARAAKEPWVAWYNGHAAEMRGPELPIALIGPWGKLKAYAARLALVL
jgi:hypothetical protein